VAIAAAMREFEQATREELVREIVKLRGANK
jgi:hypothetical protein